MDWGYFHFLARFIHLRNSFFIAVLFHYASKAGICIVTLTAFVDRGILPFVRDVTINFFYAFGDGLRIEWQGAIRQENRVRRDIARQTVYVWGWEAIFGWETRRVTIFFGLHPYHL